MKGDSATRQNLRFDELFEENASDRSGKERGEQRELRTDMQKDRPASPQ